MKLLVDFGNSRLKWATICDRRFAPGGVFAHAGAASLTDALRANWSALPRPQAVLVASVVTPARDAELAAFARDRFGLAAEFLVSPRTALGIHNAYVKPERLGIDRFLALAALHAANPRLQVLASVGTALTLDALGADGHHIGGLITASPALTRDAVLGSTARVGEAQGQLVECADNSADALYSGSLLAAAALIERFHRTGARRFGGAPALVLSGGGGEELASLLPAAERRHDLVLRGLALWAALA